MLYTAHFPFPSIVSLSVHTSEFSGNSNSSLSEGNKSKFDALAVTNLNNWPDPGVDVWSIYISFDLIENWSGEFIDATKYIPLSWSVNCVNDTISPTDNLCGPLVVNLISDPGTVTIASTTDAETSVYLNTSHSLFCLNPSHAVSPNLRTWLFRISNKLFSL